ncbi:unnamed protein product [Penicillium salamii]|uniref:RRM domain-containing protein n=1 Tax=Penicillium salamii TaxID=1612424 RepID=A0A9W4NZ23_9EURO|nr:unnamed protein product [Penicillium salamii]CAG7953409.1 unnamed protein product [Penicillium salamii]CAG8003274.1 unnamed protein product [Penicillium salamii]CAG8046627.1 unnamed protein product [Penicillium salamii]CAG8136219.1 unnamed protein product [Penicillium salamii]
MAVPTPDKPLNLISLDEEDSAPDRLEPSVVLTAWDQANRAGTSSSDDSGTLPATSTPRPTTAVTNVCKVWSSPSSMCTHTDISSGSEGAPHQPEIGTPTVISTTPARYLPPGNVLVSNISLPISPSISPHSSPLSSTSSSLPSVSTLTAEDFYSQGHIHPFIFQDFLSRVNWHDMAWPLGNESGPNDNVLARLQSASVEDLLQSVTATIGETTSKHLPVLGGVVKVTNIPYTITRQEVNSFLGRGSNPIGSDHGPHIHIIMERSTGKTMDCFVEYRTLEDARRTCASLNRNYDLGSAPRMGARHVDVEMSSAAELMKALFPLAKCISWPNGKPVVSSRRPSWSTGFDGFLTDEELFCLKRHAEQPHRSAFASKVPQRCFESLISTIWKFPWNANNLYTIYQRNQLFQLLCQMIDILIDRMHQNNTVGLDHRLLLELTRTGINCPGFNPRQKWTVAYHSQDRNIMRTVSQDWCITFPFDCLSYLPNLVPLDLKMIAYVMSHDVVNFTGGEFKPVTNIPGVRRPWGPNFFEWTPEAARNVMFAVALKHEADIIRAFVSTGFSNLLKGHLSTSTVGTAPTSSQEGDNGSVSSSRTILTNAQISSGTGRPSVVVVPSRDHMPRGAPAPMGRVDDPVPLREPPELLVWIEKNVPLPFSPATPGATQAAGPATPAVNPWAAQAANPWANPEGTTSNFPRPIIRPFRRRAIRTVHRDPREFTKDWVFPLTPTAEEPAAEEAADATPRAGSQSTEAVPTANRPLSQQSSTYRPPHVRTLTADNVASGVSDLVTRTRGMNMSTSSSGSSAATYHVPHATAQNVRSSSFSELETAPLSLDMTHHHSYSEVLRDTGFSASRRFDPTIWAANPIFANRGPPGLLPAATIEQQPSASGESSSEQSASTGLGSEHQ